MLTLVFGLVFTAVGTYGFIYNRRLARNSLRADAEVVDLYVSYRGSEDGSPTYYPIVRFQTVGGREVVARARGGGKPAPARPGDQVRVIYQPGNPQIVSLDTIMGRAVVPLALVILLGLGLTAYQAYQIVR